ncbi:hypothetical protein [Anabaena cylindrica]|uniref:Uncharacterized protein n=2 Tax=Nostocaceae TaxID=1162 RepID=K9Z9V4_ANACC|nr:hypothetical protein [Anabaena cylindrica]AFZ55983.1 hypothetical protein Anacy_0381 [Anabaena cylindrica PCC 7122]
MYRRNGTSWSVVGKSDLKTPAVGANSFNLPTPIQVKAGDFVGLYYPKQGSVAYTLNGPDNLGTGNFSGTILQTRDGSGVDSATNFAFSSDRVYSVSVKGPAQ